MYKTDTYFQYIYSFIIISYQTWKDIVMHIPNTNVAAILTSIISMVILYLVKVQINQRFKSKLKIPIPIEIIVVSMNVSNTF
jgi:hypothetical protein